MSKRPFHSYLETFSRQSRMSNGMEWYGIDPKERSQLPASESQAQGSETSWIVTGSTWAQTMMVDSKLKEIKCPTLFLSLCKLKVHLQTFWDLRNILNPLPSLNLNRITLTSYIQKWGFRLPSSLLYIRKSDFQCVVWRLAIPPMNAKRQKT
jgi:hypothetical protein